MQYHYVVTRLIDLLTPLANGRLVVDEDTELASHLALDSVQVIELVAVVEDEFDISISINAIAEVKTVREFALQIQKIVNANR
ncbi:acyl carrier protein [Burkholderia sp. 22PA0106]|uniref:acyl carrier protein n=1 Tax=Burkholderia sp. 22PA0106 TaxID=3237371 RepID=UPI0039C3EC1A